MCIIRADIFFYGALTMGTKGFFNLKSSLMSSLDLPASFEYLCLGSTAIKIFNYFSAGTDFRRQNLTSVDVRF